MMRVWAFALVAVLVLAGCTQPTDDDATEGSGGNGLDVAALDVATSPSDCNVGGLILPTPFEDLAPHLPAGFKARDVQAMLGTPVPVGQGGLAVFHLDCASSMLGAGFQTGEVLIIVDPPSVNATLEATTIDFYTVAFHVAPGPLRDLLAGAGWDLLDGEDSVEVGALGVAATLAASYADESGGQQWSFGTTSPASVAFANFERIWYETPSGLSFIENDYAVDGFIGPAECAMAAGSPVAAVVGRSSCQPGDVVAAASGVGWTARVVTLPGVTAA